MKKLSAILVIIAVFMPRISQSQWQTEDYAAIAKMVAGLKIMLQQNPSAAEVEKELSQIPNSKPYVNRNGYQGQVLMHEGKELMFFFATYSGGVAVTANIGTAPIAVSERPRIFNLFYYALSNHYSSLSKYKFDLGNGYVAYLDEAEKGYSIQIMR